MKTANRAITAKPRIIFAPILLAVILAALFCKSFLPGYVHFSNDGPLGQQNAAWRQLPAAFTGSWYDINDIGNSAGSVAPTPSVLIFWVLGPVGYAKFLAPVALFILGLGAWAFFRQLRLSPLAATLGALAATLNSTFFATACWGVAQQQIAIGMDFFALALVVSNVAGTPWLIRWSRLALAGLCVGINVMEAADIGALFSLFIAAFVFFKSLADGDGPVLKNVVRGASRVAIVSVFAGFIAAQTIVSLVGTAIVGVAGTAQNTETKAQHWDWATQWSLPKTETLGLIVPGLFGYKMDTPQNMMPLFQETYRGGLYWGGVGRDPAIDRYFDAGGTDAPPPGFMRFTGGGDYAGILVALVALWTMAQSFRRQNSPFSGAQKRMIWFWAAVLAVSLPLAWGRFAPFSKTSDSMMFYALLYKLPYFSTIRNPAKFLIFLSWAAVILFAYGVHALNRRHLDPAATKSSGLATQLKNWWARASGFDRKWTFACGGIFGASVLAWLIYSTQKPGLIHYLQKTGFPDEILARQIAAFSISQAGWFLLLFAAAAALVILIIAGYFAGPRAKTGALLLGAFLIFDLGRADLPYIIHWDYKQKYDIDPNDPAKSTNPIINLLRDKPYEHRVAYALPQPMQTPSSFGLFNDLYRIEWAQHHFPYYNVQSLDKIQMSRMPADLEAFENALRIGIKQNGSGQLMLDVGTFPRVTRLWELTNTRYLLGPASLLDLLNEQFDPMQHRFRIVQRFDVVPKPGIEQATQLTELTAVPGDNGTYALIEFTGALPRAKLYSHWQVSTNDQTTLQTLTKADFDPQLTVLVSTPLPVAGLTNQNPGAVEYKSYAPNHIVLGAQAAAPSVLLLNDMFDPEWRVFVDGKPAELLRCNFIMRGVYLTPGAHTVEFQFRLPNKPLYITLAALGGGILLCGFLFVAGRRGLPRQV